jgi:hypothetical protein
VTARSGLPQFLAAASTVVVLLEPIIVNPGTMRNDCSDE